MNRRKFIPIASLGTMLIIAGFFPSIRRMPSYEPVKTVMIILMAFLLSDALISRPFVGRSRAAVDSKGRSWLFWSVSAILACWFAGEMFTMAVDLHARATPLFKDAVGALHQSQTANDALGGDVRIGWPVEESMNVSGRVGRASMRIPVAGMGQKGQLLLEGVETDGVWRIEALHLIIPATGADQQL